MPIALGWGAGASGEGDGTRRSGGLIVSQVLTLYLTPVVYLYFERFQEWFRRARGVHPERGEIHSVVTLGRVLTFFGTISRHFVIVGIELDAFTIRADTFSAEAFDLGRQSLNKTVASQPLQL